MGALGAKAAALFHAARRGGTEHGVASFSAGHWAKPAIQQPWGDTDAQSSPPGIVFHPASAIDATAVAQVQTDLRRRILRAFVGWGLLQSCDAKEMLAYQRSGFSVDAGVRSEADDRAALERLLRYFARPPFACERLR